jgi:hypothetical protein
VEAPVTYTLTWCDETETQADHICRKLHQDIPHRPITVPVGCSYEDALAIAHTVQQNPRTVAAGEA